MRKGGTVRDPVVVVGRPGQADVRELRRLYSVRMSFLPAFSNGARGN